ncbi:MAG: hypothetical protein GY866_31280 [Proteobacteria bacterium]|nr:hypothetical protein [Pseudomonadota bacterium]
MNISQDITLMRMNHNRFPKQALQKPTENHSEKETFNKDLRKATDGFEELFVHKMLQIMRKSVQKNNFLSGGRGEEIFQDMLDENYAKIITQSGSFGLSDLIYEQTKK